MKFSNSEVKVAAVAGAYNLALPGRRFVAYLIDGVCVSILCVIPYVGALLGVAYFLLRDGVGGGGVGKRVMGLRAVEKETLRPISGQYGTAALRTVSLYIPIYNIIDALQVFDTTDLRQRFGDRWAKTLVVRDIRLSDNNDKK